VNVPKMIKAHHREILNFSTPLLLGMISQNLMGIIDTAFIGMLGTSSLAAAGLSFFILFTHTAPLLGLAIAVQTLTAKRVGAKEAGIVAFPLNSALVISCLFGIPITLMALGYIEELLSLMTSDPATVKEGVSYMNTRLWGIVAIGITHSFRGFWNGLSKTRVYLGIVVIMHISNALLSYSLMFGKWGAPAMGIAGVGLGSTLATFLGVILHVILSFNMARSLGFARKFFDLTVWKHLISQSLPSALQQFLFAIGFAVFFSIIGMMGPKELAAANVLISLSLFLIYPGMAMGMTAATYISRSLGANNRDQAKWWGNKVLKLSMVTTILVSIVILLMPRSILSFFIHEKAVLELAYWPLIIVASTLFLEIAGQIYAYKFFGSGDPKVILKVTIPIQWLLIIPCSYIAGPLLGLGLTEVWLIQTGFRSLQAVILHFLWNRNHWGKNLSS
jgi:multidrug resistance protein, MATE family